MKTVLKVILLGASGAVLSACGGSGGGDGPQLLTFAELEVDEDALRTATGGLTIVNPGDLPPSGTATYNGTLGFILDEGGADEVQLLSDLTLTASFAGNAVGGNARNFVDSTEEQYTGTLDLLNGVINPMANPAIEYTFNADLDGTLRNSGGDEFVSIADIRGEFLGSGATGPDTHISGIVAGNFVKNGTPLAIANEGMTPTDNVFFGSR